MKSAWKSGLLGGLAAQIGIILFLCIRAFIGSEEVPSWPDKKHVWREPRAAGSASASLEAAEAEKKEAWEQALDIRNEGIAKCRASGNVPAMGFGTGFVCIRQSAVESEIDSDVSVW